MTNRALILYVPVLHAGYLKLFEKYRGKVYALYLLGEDVVSEFSLLHKEIRALNPEIAAHFIASLEMFGEIKVLERDTLRRQLSELKNVRIVATGDELSRAFVKKYLPRAGVTFENIFLRWDAKNVNSSKAPEGVKISRSKFDRSVITRIKQEGVKSSDWWRQVGGAIVKKGKVILESHNRHVPSEHMPYLDGDPRDVIPAGTQSHLSTAIHSEQLLIAEAAKRGVALDGASIYVTVFPCPVCAKLIAYSGVKKCFFAGGHASLDGERVLKANGIEMIFVK
jgi:dCMP deaminase